MPQAPASRPTLLSLGSAFPRYELSQQELWDGLLKHWYRTLPNAERIIWSTRVKKRRMAWDPREVLAEGTLPIEQRMVAHANALVEVGGKSLATVLGGVKDKRAIGSFVMSCSSGYTGPTPDLLLAKNFSLRSDLRRTHIGHMGCFAAFNVLKVAMDSLAARPEELVLANCTEFSSLNFRPEPTAEQAVTHALFGDASASMLLGTAPDGEGIQFLRTHTEQFYDTHELMTLIIKNDGFAMTLSPYVPFVLQEGIEPYLEKLLGPEGLTVGDIRHWGIHPGGPKIVELLSRKLGLSEAQQRASWSVLAEYGNCASATILLVLEDILKNDQPRKGEYGVILAFGPGLTIEGALLRF